MFTEFQFIGSWCWCVTPSTAVVDIDTSGLPKRKSFCLSLTVDPCRPRTDEQWFRSSAQRNSRNSLATTRYPWRGWRCGEEIRSKGGGYIASDEDGPSLPWVDRRQASTVKCECFGSCSMSAKCESMQRSSMTVPKTACKCTSNNNAGLQHDVG